MDSVKRDYFNRFSRNFAEKSKSQPTIPHLRIAHATITESMDTVAGSTSSVPQSQGATSDGSGMLTSMLVSTPVFKTVISPTIPKQSGVGGQKHVPLMRTMQQDESAALSAVKNTDQSQNKHPEIKKGGFFSSLLGHHDSQTSHQPTPVVQSQVNVPPPPRIVPPPQINPAQPMRSAPPGPPAQPQRIVPPVTSKVATTISQPMQRIPTQAMPQNRPAVLQSPVLRTTAPSVPVRSVAPVISRPTAPPAPVQVQAVLRQVPQQIPNVQQQPLKSSVQTSQVTSNGVKASTPLQQQPHLQRPVSGQSQTFASSAPVQRPVPMPPVLKSNPLPPPMNSQSRVDFSAPSATSVAAAVQALTQKATPIPQAPVREMPKITSGPTPSISAVPAKLPIANTNLRPMAQTMPQSTVSISPKVENQNAPHAVVPAFDIHPVVKNPIISPPSPTSSPAKPIVAGGATTQQMRPPMKHEPFLPTLSKQPASSTSQNGVALPPLSTKNPVPIGSSSTQGMPTPPAKTQIPQVVLPPLSVPPPPVSPKPTSTVSPVTHGTLPNRVGANSTATAFPAKHPLSEVFPTKQAVIDGAHDALVKSGVLSQEGGLGAGDRVTNYVDARLEDDNIFGGKNKGTSQVVWGIVKELHADAVIAGDLPTEELSREHHVQHELHEQAYTMVRDVAKKLSLSPLPDETVHAFLVRAATTGPLF